jgi:hypothetical protein
MNDQNLADDRINRKWLAGVEAYLVTRISPSPSRTTSSSCIIFYQRCIAAGHGSTRRHERDARPDQPFFPLLDAAELNDTVIPGHREAMNSESRDDLREILRCAIAHLRFALTRAPE